jgi:hypothetical protein
MILGEKTPINCCKKIMLIFDTTMVECNYAKTYAGRDGWTCQHSGLNSGNIMYLKENFQFFFNCEIKIAVQEIPTNKKW